MQAQKSEEEITKKKFEPFAFKIQVEDADELLELYHRFNLNIGRLRTLYNDGLPPKWHFRTEKCHDIRKILNDEIRYFGLEP